LLKTRYNQKRSFERNQYEPGLRMSFNKIPDPGPESNSKFKYKN